MKLSKLNKRGMSLAAGLSFIGVFVALILMVTFTSDIVGDVQNDSTSSEVFNVANEGVEGLSNFSERFGNLGTIGIVAILLTVLLGAFMFARGRDII
jgi:hypothetical protein